MIAKVIARAFCCSFCGKSKDEVSAMMAGAPTAAAGAPLSPRRKSAFICNECVQRYYQKLTARDTPKSSALSLK